MAGSEDTEKRFYSIMDKLFHSPKSTLPLSSGSSSVQSIRGQKRPFSAVGTNSKGDKAEGIPNAAQAPPCRPWDRGDLIRRLATFKSMTWFGKPKVVDAVNCARRGWVNVDMDIIACEVCGARVQFSTPSTWSQQQVEKAAQVFSLKLDNGHKLLCPWIDNACDESLAVFPPMTAPMLVDHYKDRSSALLQLSALPVISNSAIQSMRNPQLEHFLKQSIAVECGTGPNGSSWTEYLGNDVEAVSADHYYQAHRLLSLCGWEPQLLPYMVDCGDQSKESTRKADLSNFPYNSASEQGTKLSVYFSKSKEIEGQNERPVVSGVHYDPNSTVLDCKLCGARIGLWAFTTVPRPLELVRVVGYAEIDGGGNPGSRNSAVENHANNGNLEFGTVNKEATSSRETLSSLTIAGGPPPTKQNFRATISLPVIGRNVRARFSYDSSELTDTSEQRHASPNAVMEGSAADVENLERGSGIANNLPSVEDVGKFGQPDGDFQGALSSTVVDDSCHVQRMPTDNAVLMKDASSVHNGGGKEDRVGNMKETAFQKNISTTSIDKDPRRHPSDKKMEFHPIRQHRHFCPWVAASTNTTAPGWQQTLSALQKEKVFSLPEPKDSPSSPSLIKVDDPITSIRKLFESPSSKRAKPASTS